MFKGLHLIVTSLSSSPITFLWSFCSRHSGHDEISQLCKPQTFALTFVLGGPFPEIFTYLASSTSGIYSNISSSMRHFLTTLLRMWITPNSWHVWFFIPALFFPIATHHYLIHYILFHLFILFTVSLLPLNIKFHEGKEFWLMIQCCPGTQWHSIYWMHE